MKAQFAAMAFLVAAAISGCGSDQHEPVSEPDSGANDNAVCPASVSAFTPDATAMGTSGVLQLALVDAAPSAPALFRNEWTLEVRNADGAVIHDAELAKVQTYMTVHGHEGQPAATVNDRLQASLYFQMRGPWEVRFDISSASAGADHVVFTVCVPE